MNTQIFALTNKYRTLSIAFLTIVLLQTLVLVYMIGSRQYILSTGTSVLLETIPIDPRSLFSGDYVRLDYKISNIDLSDIPGDKNFKRGDTVYVTLQDTSSQSSQVPKVPSNGITNTVTSTAESLPSVPSNDSNRFWKPVYISKTAPEHDSQAYPNPSAIQSNANKVVIRGIATQKTNTALNADPELMAMQNPDGLKEILTVWYGIEQYYVPEGKGLALEQAAAQRQLFVKVKIDKFGHAAIAGLVADGQDVYQEKLFN